MPTIPLESHLDFQNVARLKNLPAPAASTDAARQLDIDNAVEGIKQKDNVRCATSSNINLASPGATLDGITMASGDRVLVRGQTSVPANGVYVYNGSGSPMTRSSDASTVTELNNAIVGVNEGTDADVVWRQTTALVTLDSDNVVWATWGSATPDASPTTKGKIEIASQEEVDDEADTVRAVTPATLGAWSGRYRSGGTLIGDGSATQFDITHNYGTRDVAIHVMQAGGDYKEVWVDKKAHTTAVVRVNFITAPGNDEFRVLIQKIG